MSISKRLRFEIFKRDNFTCQYCGAKPPDTILEVDHVHPRCQGGTDEIHNLKTACWACNRGKAGIPITPVNEYSLVGGGPIPNVKPLRLSQYFFRPLVWVMVNDLGEQMLYEDEWMDGEGGRKPRHGHPGFQTNRKATEANEWFHKSYHAGLNPRVIGAYSSEAVDDEPTIALAWWDVDRVIVELTA